MKLIDVLLAFCSGVVALRHGRRPTTSSHDRTGCHTVQEALLVGICLLRSGALETILYDATMAHTPCRQQGALPAASQSSGVEPVAHRTLDRLSLGA